jgi:hypothetical protein
MEKNLDPRFGINISDYFTESLEKTVFRTKKILKLFHADPESF